MLLSKPGVRITAIRPEMVLAVVAAERVYEEMGVDCVVTACVDGLRRIVPLRRSCRRSVNPRRSRREPAEARGTPARLPGRRFDVLLDKDHIHIEFEPKGAITL